MKAYRCSKQLRRRRPNRTGARAPSPEYHIGDRHKRSQRAKLEIMLDYSIGIPPLEGDYPRSNTSAYNKRGPRIYPEYHPLKVPISSIEFYGKDTGWDLPPFMDDIDHNTMLPL